MLKLLFWLGKILFYLWVFLGLEIKFVHKYVQMCPFYEERGVRGCTTEPQIRMCHLCHLPFFSWFSYLNSMKTVQEVFSVQ